MVSLTVEKARRLTEPGRYGDGGGLYLNIAKGGSKSWVQRLYVEGKRLDKGLGGFPKVSLTDARKMATSNRAAVAEGRNPWADGQPKAAAGVQQIPTFRAATFKAHERKAHLWRNAKHTASWIQTLERHAFPIIGDMRMDEITRADVLAVLDPIWREIPENARRVRQRMRSVFSWAMSWGYTDVNPAGEVIDAALDPMPRLVNGNFPALPYEQVPEAIRKIQDSESWAATKLAFEFLILTAARSGEVRGATWDEIDLDADLWTVPSERMKMGREHRQPLSIQAVVLLRGARERLGGGSRLVFPSPGGNMLSDNALSLRARKDAIGCVPHGFRSSFRDWAAECSGASRDAIELSLAHDVGNAVERAYFRTDLLEKRRPLMQSWADYLDPLPF